MPPHARRRSPKIVAPQETNKEQGLIGGLQNAISRGENITKAKQSFISAGYKPQEIEAAAKKVSAIPKAIQQAPTPTSTPIPNPTKQQPTPTPQSQFTTTTKPGQKKQTSKKFIIIIAAIAILILAGATLLGLFWGKIFT